MFHPQGFDGRTDWGLWRTKLAALEFPMRWSTSKKEIWWFQPLWKIPSGNLTKLLEMAIEIVYFPIKKAMFNSYVKLPKGIHDIHYWWFHDWLIGFSLSLLPKISMTDWWGPTYPSEKWWSSSMASGWQPIYEMENNPAMFETTNQIYNIYIYIPSGNLLHSYWKWP